MTRPSELKLCSHTRSLAFALNEHPIEVNIVNGGRRYKFLDENESFSLKDIVIRLEQILKKEKDEKVVTDPADIKSILKSVELLDLKGNIELRQKHSQCFLLKIMTFIKRLFGNLFYNRENHLTQIAEQFSIDPKTLYFKRVDESNPYNLSEKSLEIVTNHIEDFEPYKSKYYFYQEVVEAYKFRQELIENNILNQNDEILISNLNSFKRALVRSSVDFKKLSFEFDNPAFITDFVKQLKTLSEKEIVEIMRHIAYHDIHHFSMFAEPILQCDDFLGYEDLYEFVTTWNPLHRYNDLLEEILDNPQTAFVEQEMAEELRAQ
jgi:hypothetical protein